MIEYRLPRVMLTQKEQKPKRRWKYRMLEDPTVGCLLNMLTQNNMWVITQTLSVVLQDYLMAEPGNIFNRFNQPKAKFMTYKLNSTRTYILAKQRMRDHLLPDLISAL